jgi:hypothetical protein
MRHGGVAVEELEHKEMDRRERVQQALSPAIADLMTDLGDGLGLEMLSQVLAELTEDSKESKIHGKASCTKV